jgi:hypothetical protein
MSLALPETCPISQELRALEEYWRSKKIGDALPSRRDIDPWEMRTFLRQVFLITVTRSPLRFWFRLVGSGVADGYGEDVTGKYLDEIDLDEVRTEIIEDYRAATLERRPVRSTWDFIKDDRKRLRYERLLLPLSSDGETVDMLLGGAVRLGRGEQQSRSG